MPPEQGLDARHAELGLVGHDVVEREHALGLAHEFGVPELREDGLDDADGLVDAAEVPEQVERAHEGDGGALEVVAGEGLDLREHRLDLVGLPEEEAVGEHVARLEAGLEVERGPARRTATLSSLANAAMRAASSSRSGRAVPPPSSRQRATRSTSPRRRTPLASTSSASARHTARARNSGVRSRSTSPWGVRQPGLHPAVVQLGGQQAPALEALQRGAAAQALDDVARWARRRRRARAPRSPRRRGRRGRPRPGR